MLARLSETPRCEWFLVQSEYGCGMHALQDVPKDQSVDCQPPGGHEPIKNDQAAPYTPRPQHRPHKVDSTLPNQGVEAVHAAPTAPKTCVPPDLDHVCAQAKLIFSASPPHESFY